MKGNVFCLSNSSLEGVYMIGSTAFPLENLLREIEDKNITTPFKKEYSIESNSILTKERTIRKLLKDYSYEKKRRFFKIELETIIKLFEDLDKLEELEKDKEILRIRNEKLKIETCVNFINENFESIDNIKNEELDPDDPRSIKIGNLYDMYIIWCRKQDILPNIRTGICEFEKVCEKHTFLGKLSDYCEFNFVKLKT
jgi:hypothetical protein